mgnify:CR=1 FL=1
MHLDIVSAEEEIFSGNVKNIIAAAMMGEVGIYPQHTPMITPLKPGEVKVISEEDEEHFAFDQRPFGICAPRDCYDERTGAFALNPVSILDLSMKDEALRIKLSEHGVHESLMDGVADILYARGTPREEWVMPYHRAEPLHIAILGFPECGTTQLAYNLGLHPHIVFSELGNDVDVFQYGVMYASELQNFVADDPKYAQRLNELSFEQKHLLQVGFRVVFLKGKEDLQKKKH